jgi:hypothetical protein
MGCEEISAGGLVMPGFLAGRAFMRGKALEGFSRVGCLEILLAERAYERGVSIAGTFKDQDRPGNRA